MTSPLVGGPSLATESADFAAELEQVRELLVASLDGLYPPLSSLARAAIRDALPLRRAALVLAVAVANEESDLDLTSDQLRERRILLAAALEMLNVALSIHSHLLGRTQAANDQTLDKSIVGSTILTGDYCFSRAAWLAAQTESPVVVDHFAQALKSVSEGLLRAQLQPDDPQREPALELSIASVHAAAHLASLSAAAREQALQLAPLFAARQQVGPSDVEEVPIGDSTAVLAEDSFSTAQAQRRHAALTWLASLPPDTQRKHGGPL